MGHAQTPPQTYRDLAYVTGGHARQKLDLYLPADRKNAPLILYIHGGAYLFGDKDNNLLPKRLLAKGYAIASINYRLSHQAIYPAQIEDCKAAVRWLRAHATDYGLQPQKIIAWGDSAGGHLAALLGVMGDTKGFDVGENLAFSSAVQGVVDYYGPTDFLQMDAHAIPGTEQHNSPDSPASKVIGGAIQENKEKVARANPMTYLSPQAPPFFIAHGTQDRVVPYHQSELLCAALAKAGVRFTFHPVQKTDHGFLGISPAQGQQLEKATDAFIDSVFSL